MRKTLVIVGLCVLFLLVAIKSVAMPPYPDSTGGLAAAYADISHLVDHEYGPAVQTTGIWNHITICVDFTDKPFQTPLEFFDSLVYGDKFGTVKDFYARNSYEKFTLNTHHLPSNLYVRAPKPYTYYVNGGYGFSPSSNLNILVADILDAIDTIIDFSTYTNPESMDILGVSIIHAGKGAERTQSPYDIWSHAGTANQTRDGVFIRRYTMSPELNNTPGDIASRVFVHELAHILGLPDLYDRDGSSRPVGAWSIMGRSGTKLPMNFDAWCKLQMGWVVPRVIDVEELTILRSAQDCDTVLMINGPDELSYYLVENRQRVGYDDNAPWHGLLIWRIDETKLDRMHWNNNEWYPGHESFGNYLVALIQADNRWELERGRNLGDPMDPFPYERENANEFGPDTHPSSDWYDGTSTNLRIWNIKRSGENITFSISASVPVDILEPETPIADQSFGGKVAMYNILGQKIGEFHGTCLNGRIQFDSALIQCGTGVYFLRMHRGWNIYSRKIVVIK